MPADALAVVAEKLDLAMALFEYGVGGVRLLEKTLDPTPGFVAARDQMDIEWFASVVRQLNDVAARMNGFERAQLHARLTDDDGLGILAAYVQQAHGEPLRERRRMLEHAAVGLTNLHLGIAELARVQRVLRELEPDDLVVLYGLWLAKGHLNVPPYANRDAVLRLRLWHESGAESLETAGCVRVEAKGGGAGAGTHEELKVTRTGQLLLRALRSYLSARQPDLSKTPGHETAPDFRCEEEARAIIGAVPGLYEALLAQRGIGFGTVQYDSISPERGLPSNGKTKLILDMPTVVAEQLRRLTTREAAEMGQPVTGIFVDLISPTEDAEVVSVQIAGPHDVLRWLAYDLDAWWA